MSRLRPNTQSHVGFKIAMLFALVALVLSSVGSLQAQSSVKRPVNDPHTIVSNDGVVPRTTSSSIEQAKLRGYSASYQGTGLIPVNVAKATKDPKVGPVPQGGMISPLSIIGPDGRYQITGTTAYPYRAIVHVTSSIGGCSGWLIGANTVATAGHCIHNGAWATNVVVYPGRNGSSTPYGSCTASRLYSVTGWTTNRDRNYDYGAIKLNCTIGNTTGWFGFRWQSASLTGQPSYTAGYPGDKPYGTMWRSDDQVRTTQTYRLYYANDTIGGQSGSVVWNNEASCSTCGIAIHAYGVDGTGYNGGTRITQQVYNNLVTWRDS